MLDSECCTTMFTLLAPNSLEHHTLLDPPSIEYSAGTVQRACLVWTRLGQKNRFTDVCGYFHRLEALEETIPSEQRAYSRGLEYSLLTSPPPASSYLQANHRSLYPDLTSLTQQYDDVKRLNELKVKLAATMAKNEKTNCYRQAQNCVIQNNMGSGTTLMRDLEIGVAGSQWFPGPVDGEAFINQVATHSGAFIQGKTSQNIEQGTIGLATLNVTTQEDIVATSKIISSYCMTHQMTLRQFLAEFKEYATKHGVNPTVSNVAFYIKHKTVLEERELEANITRNEEKKLFTPSPVHSIKGNTKTDAEVIRGINIHKKPEVSSSIDVKSIVTDGQISHRLSEDCQTSKIEPMSDIDQILDQISQMRTVFNDELNGLQLDIERGLNITENSNVILEGADTTEKSPIELESKELSKVVSKDSSDRESEHAMCVPISRNSSVDTITIPTKEKVGSKQRSVFGLKIVNLRGKSRKGAKNNSSRRSSLKDKLSKMKSVTSISIDSFADSNESSNLIDCESSFENCSNFSEDFDKMPNNRCSTSSR